MKLKFATLLFILWASNTNVKETNIQPSLKVSQIESVIKSQLENLLANLEIDEFSAELVKKYTKKGDYNTNTRKEIRTLCVDLNIKEEWIYKLFKIESGGNPAAVNRLSNATGLIQFMPNTAKSLSTTTEALKQMSVSEQLPYIKEYLTRVKGTRHFNDFLDLYLAVLYPRAINESHDFILGKEVSDGRALLVRAQNKAFDKRGDNNGYVTKGEIADFVS